MKTEFATMRILKLCLVKKWTSYSEIMTPYDAIKLSFSKSKEGGGAMCIGDCPCEVQHIRLACQPPSKVARAQTITAKVSQVIIIY